MRQLDFIVIGAAKSGTTTLFDLMKDHPEIYMPPEKEVPFFNSNSVFKKGYSWYLKTYFASAKKTQKIGTITPQYMLGDTKLIAERIRKNSPNVKIVAILRHPIERSFSHFQMLKQRGYFANSFEDTTQKFLKRQSDKPEKEKQDSTYFTASIYSKKLRDYLKEFGATNILILYTDELKINPKNVMNKLFRFIDVDPSYNPSGLGKVSRKGGSSPRLKLLTPGFIFKIPLVKYIWKNLTPYKLRKKVEYNLNLWNTKPGNEKLDKSSDFYGQLAEYFREDTEKLKKDFKTSPPWQDLA